jgi:alkyl hydroperoxide reductase subunit AhpC
VQDLTVGRSVDEILRLLFALKTGELTPVGWRPGEPFIPPVPKNTRK